MSSEIAIAVEGAGKCYLVYDKPQDRLKQAVLGTLARLLGRPVPRFFREFWALRGVGFSIRKGETVGIIGRNGAGKSTLLQMICGTLTPTTGAIAADGRIAALLELGAGFNPEFTGRENVRLNASILGLSDREIEERLPAIVEFAGLGDFIDQPVKTYSSGMAVRLAFAVMAHVDADILIIDEALAVGDAFFVQKCMRFLRAFAQTGTLLFVSHDSSAVLALCDRAIWLDGGTLVRDGTPKEVSDAYLAKLYESAQGPDSALRTEPATPEPDAAAEFQAGLHEGATQFGAGGAEIKGVKLVDATGSTLLGVEGGERVSLVVSVQSHVAMTQPIIGFYIRDRLGQNLLGENTYLAYEGAQPVVAAGGRLRARFDFEMPYLLNGDYSICVAIADGTQDTHVQHHWVNDAFIFKSLVHHNHRGLIGLPGMRVRLEASGP